MASGEMESKVMRGTKVIQNESTGKCAAPMVVMNDNALWFPHDVACPIFAEYILMCIRYFKKYGNLPMLPVL